MEIHIDLKKLKICWKKIDNFFIQSGSIFNYNMAQISLDKYKHLFKKKFYTIVKNKLYKNKNIKDLHALKQYENNYDYLPKELENYFDGEVSILLVDKNYRGKSIGKKLLLEVFNLAKKDNMKNLQILTDESCNFKFYENCGCKKIYETIVKNQEYGKLGNISSEKAFIYEKNLI